MHMNQRLSPSQLVSRSIAVALFAGASSLAMHAQQTAVQADDAGGPVARLFAANTTPNLDLAAAAGVNYSSSSSSSTEAADSVDAERLNLSSDALQPPPRRRYGRPRYNDSSHNPDGSNKYTFVVGGGFTAPIGNTYHYLNTNYAFQVGGGRNFSKKFATLLQFDYDRFGFNGRTLYNQSIVEDPNNSYGILGALDGNSHVWSFTVNPVYTFFQGDTVGAYIVGGVGFYHKVANFTLPETVQGYDYFGYPVQYTANEVIDHYTSNAPGFNGGFGLTYKFSRFASERFFAEGRYVFVDNQQRTGFTVANASQETIYSTNLYPANSNRTTYTVYKAGIRF